MVMFAPSVDASINLIVQAKKQDVAAINLSLNNNNICTIDTRGDYGLPFFYSDNSLSKHLTSFRYYCNNRHFMVIIK
jgi:hypothetical protein